MNDSFWIVLTALLSAIIAVGTVILVVPAVREFLHIGGGPKVDVAWADAIRVTEDFPEGSGRYPFVTVKVRNISAVAIHDLNIHFNTEPDPVEYDYFRTDEPPLSLNAPLVATEWRETDGMQVLSAKSSEWKVRRVVARVSWRVAGKQRRIHSLKFKSPDYRRAASADWLRQLPIA